MELTFIPIDYDYFDFQGKNIVRIIGRNEKGKRICIVDDFSPYLYAILEEDISEKRIHELIEKIEKIKIETGNRTTKIEKIQIESKNFLGKQAKALKIFITNYKDAHPVADKLDFPEIIARREYDIPLITKYIIDRKVLPLQTYKIKGELIQGNDFGGIGNIDVESVLKAEKIEQTKEIEFEPKILAYDIEASEFEAGKGEILMISLAGKNFKKVLTWKKCSKSQDYVECFKDEAEMIEKFVEYVKKLEPDFLVGYFSDGFDLPYLRARAEKNKIRLNLGLDNSQPSFARGRIPKASISGIVHIDLFRFIETVYSQYLESETLSLDEVSKELLGEGKKDFEFKDAEKIKEHEWKNYFEYNLQDSVLTYKLAEKFWPDMIEFSKILQEPLFEITRDSMSQHVENYILHNLEKYNEIAEKRPHFDEIGERKEKEKYLGAFVLAPNPGLYENIVFFDFTSMYSSVIVSYNLSKTTLLEKKSKNSTEVDLKEGKAYFSKETGFFSKMLSEIIEQRKKHKKEYKLNPNNYTKARSNAYKLLANAAYGYQGFFGARYYCREAAASAAALARKSILETIEKIKKSGFQVIYSDTDSISLLRNTKSKQEVLDLLKKLNKNLPGIMEIELEDFYKRGIFVSKRASESGAKKKYALITEQGKMKIRGFETVRRDWCFPPDTNILTEEGVKYIKDVKDNESVLTHKGEFQKVKFLSQREYQGRLIEIIPYYLQKIKATPEHPFLAIKTKMCRYKSNTICKQTCKKKNQSCEKYYKFYKPKWIKAKELSKGDIILSPIINKTKKIKFNANRFLEKNRFTIKRDTIKNVKESYSSIRIVQPKISEDLFYLFGLYTAEGYATDTYHGYIRFTFNRKEKNLIEKTSSIMKKLFNVKALIIERNSLGRENVTEIVFYSKILGSLFKNLFGSKANMKKIPMWILTSPKKYQIAFIRGMFDGDGSYKNIRFRGIIYDTVSKNLAFQFQLILLRLGIISSLKIGKINPTKIGNRVIKTKNNLYSVIISGEQLIRANKIFNINYLWVNKRKRTSQHGYIDKYYSYSPIKNIITKNYKGFVYNLEVERDNSYTANMACVHNCNLAREMQSEVLELILKNGNEKSALELVKKIIKNLKERKISRDEILIRTQLKKPISEYKSITPHVIAAGKMKEAGMPIDVGMLIEYFIAETRESKKLVREKVKLPDEKGEYNIEYYLNNQILPAVENIFDVFGISIRDIASGSSQKKLF